MACLSGGSLVSFGLRPPTEPLATETGAPLAFEERDWVLVAALENPTGEDVFHGAVDTALERELSNSSFINVVPRERVNEALRLMKTPVGTGLDAEVALEVALRDGDIKALVVPRVERRDSSYLLTASVVDLGGTTVASSAEEAANEDDLLAAMRRLSDWLRAELGEALASIAAGNERLQKVTTPSLRALQLYSRGYSEYRDRSVRPGRGAAAEFFRKAIVEDPEFASAHLMLGYSVKHRLQGGDARSPEIPLEEYLPHFERALELSPSTTERDRLFIEAVYYQHTGQPELAAATYETLLALHPDHYYALSNVGNLYSGVLGRPEDYVRVQVFRADQRPNDFAVQERVARDLQLNAPQSDRWQRYAMRAHALRPPTLDEWPNFGRPSVPSRFVWLEFVPAYVHWSRGELDEAYGEVERLTPSLEAQGPEVGSGYRDQLGSYYLAFGQLDRAIALFQGHADPNAAVGRMGWVADGLNDVATMRAQLTRLLEQTRGADRRVTSEWVRPFRVVRAGLDLEPWGFSPDSANWELAQGELALRRGALVDAVDRLEGGLKRLHEVCLEVPLPTNRCFDDLLEFFVASESLASAWLRLGDVPRALAVLDAATRRTPRNHQHILAGAFGRFRVQARLASEYRKLGRVDEAEAIEDEVLRMLKYADADHPIVRQINQSRASF